MGVRIEVKYRRTNGKKSQDDMDRDSLEIALKKFSKACDKAGVTKDFRRHEFYEKPCDKRKRDELRRIINSRKASEQKNEEDTW